MRALRNAAVAAALMSGSLLVGVRAQEVEATGSFRDGERHGPWVIRLADGRVEEGTYVDGERHGRWVLRWPDGQIEEGALEYGERLGPWIHRFPNGQEEEGAYVAGEREGWPTTRRLGPS